MKIEEHAWEMIKELRTELKETQKIRSQMIGVKIAFVSTLIGFVIGGKEGPLYNLLVVPAFAAIFFDCLIASYTFGIKRIGFYCRLYLEPKIREGTNWPPGEPLWEEAMKDKEMYQHFSGIGNIGLTALVVMPTIFYLLLLRPFGNNWGININDIIATILILLFSFDIFISYCKFTPKEKLTGWQKSSVATRKSGLVDDNDS